MTNQRAVDFVSEKVAEGLELPQICEAMMEACLATSTDQLSLGCDNMTVIIVALLKGHPKEEWAQQIKTRIQDKIKNQKGTSQEDDEDAIMDLSSEKSAGVPAAKTASDDFNGGEGVN